MIMSAQGSKTEVKTELKREIKTELEFQKKELIIREWVEEFCRENKQEEFDPALLKAMSAGETSMLTENSRPIYLKRFENVLKFYQNQLDHPDKVEAVVRSLISHIQLLDSRTPNKNKEEKRKYELCLRVFDPQDRSRGHDSGYESWLLSPQEYYALYHTEAPTVYGSKHSVRKLLAAYWLAASDPDLGTPRVPFSANKAANFSEDLAKESKVAGAAEKLRQQYREASIDMALSTLAEIQTAHTEDDPTRIPQKDKDWRSCLPGTTGRILQKFAIYNTLASVVLPPQRVIPREIELFIIEKLKMTHVEVMAAFFNAYEVLLGTSDNDEIQPADLEKINFFVSHLLSDSGIRELIQKLNKQYFILNLDFNNEKTRSRLAELVKATVCTLFNRDCFAINPPTLAFSDDLTRIVKAGLINSTKQDEQVRSFRFGIYALTPETESLDRIMENEIIRGLLAPGYFVSPRLKMKLQKFTKQIAGLAESLEKNSKEFETYCEKYKLLNEADAPSNPIKKISAHAQKLKTTLEKLKKQASLLMNLSKGEKLSQSSASTITSSSALNAEIQASSELGLTPEERQENLKSLCASLTDTNFSLNEDHLEIKETKESRGQSKVLSFPDSPKQWAFGFLRLAFQLNSDKTHLMDTTRDLKRLYELMMNKFSDAARGAEFRREVIKELISYSKTYSVAGVKDLTQVRSRAVEKLNTIFANEIQLHRDNQKIDQETVNKNLLECLYEYVSSKDKPKSSSQPTKVEEEKFNPLAVQHRISKAKDLFLKIENFIKSNSFTYPIGDASNPAREDIGPVIQKLVNFLAKELGLNLRDRFNPDINNTTINKHFIHAVKQIVVSVLMKEFQTTEVRKEDAEALWDLFCKSLRSETLGEGMGNGFIIVAKCLTTLQPVKELFHAGFVRIVTAADIISFRDLPKTNGIPNALFRVSNSNPCFLAVTVYENSRDQSLQHNGPQVTKHSVPRLNFTINNTSSTLTCNTSAGNDTFELWKSDQIVETMESLKGKWARDNIAIYGEYDKEKFTNFNLIGGIGNFQEIANTQKSIKKQEEVQEITLVKPIDDLVYRSLLDDELNPDFDMSSMTTSQMVTSTLSQATPTATSTVSSKPLVQPLPPVASSKTQERKSYTIEDLLRVKYLNIGMILDTDFELSLDSNASINVDTPKGREIAFCIQILKNLQKHIVALDKECMKETNLDKRSALINKFVDDIFSKNSFGSVFQLATKNRYVAKLHDLIIKTVSNVENSAANKMSDELFDKLRQKSELEEQQRKLKIKEKEVKEVKEREEKVNTTLVPGQNSIHQNPSAFFTQTQPVVISNHIALIGDSSVGKTCWLRKEMGEEDVTTRITIGLNFYNKTSKDLAFPDKQPRWIKSYIYDLGKFNDRYNADVNARNRQTLRTCDAVILFYDVTDESSFQNVRSYLREIEATVSSLSDKNVILVGTKIDMSGDRVVDSARGVALAEDYGLRYYECSSMTNTAFSFSKREGNAINYQQVGERIEFGQVLKDLQYDTTVRVHNITAPKKDFKPEGAKPKSQDGGCVLM